jgi:8-oxo-dGTP pyrophosphatase MutT (NUDIX family)
MNDFQFDALLGRWKEHQPIRRGRLGQRQAAVLVTILGTEEPRLIGIQRGKGGLHEGHFAFPGGRVESHDCDLWKTATREFAEELGTVINPIRISEIGEYSIKSRYSVTAFLGFLQESPDYHRQLTEVSAVFEIPIRELSNNHAALPKHSNPCDVPIQMGYDTDPQTHVVHGSFVPNIDNKRSAPGSRPIRSPFIWGLSAWILYEFFTLDERYRGATSA